MDWLKNIGMAYRNTEKTDKSIKKTRQTLRQAYLHSEVRANSQQDLLHDEEEEYDDVVEDLYAIGVKVGLRAVIGANVLDRNKLGDGDVWG